MGHAAQSILYSTRIVRHYFIHICAPISNQNLVLLTPRSQKTHHFDHQHLLHTGKIFSCLCIATICHYMEEYCTTQTARSGAEQRTLIAQLHLTGDVPSEHARLIQSSSSHQNMARRAVRSGRSKGDPGVWYWARVCILAHERRPVGSGCALLFGIQTTLRARLGPGSWLIPYVESVVLGRVEPDGQMRAFPVVGAWQGVARAAEAQKRSGIQVTARRFRVVTPPFALGL